MGGSDVMSF